VADTLQSEKSAGSTQHEAESIYEPERASSVALRAALGGILGLLPYVLSLPIPPTHRSPYLIAYPAVILSAWLWGLAGSLACATTSCLVLEVLIFSLRRIDISPGTTSWISRGGMFLAGSLMVGALTRLAANNRARTATANLQRRLKLADQVAHEKEIASELAKENQVRAEMALDGASAGLWEWDFVSNESKWSSGFYKLHGLSPGGPASYEVWRLKVHPDDINRVEVSIRKAIADCAAFAEEYRVEHPDGSQHWVAYHGTTQVDGSHRPVKIAGYCGDVTRRKLSDIALLQAEKFALAGRLSATIAHEINNPLDAAMNLLYICQQGSENAEQQTHLEEAHKQLDRVARITRQTLQLSRTREALTACRASTVVEDVTRLLHHKLANTLIRIQIESRSDPELLCYPGELQQILTNILSNAIEATSGPGLLRIRISQSVDWRNRGRLGVRISIGDTGSGMSSDIMAYVMEPFFTTKSGTGTGLGMWVVQDLMNKLGGAVSISSSKNPRRHGTVVSLFVPFKR